MLEPSRPQGRSRGGGRVFHSRSVEFGKSWTWKFIQNLLWDWVSGPYFLSQETEPVVWAFLKGWLSGLKFCGTSGGSPQNRKRPWLAKRLGSIFHVSLTLILCSLKEVILFLYLRICSLVIKWQWAYCRHLLQKHWESLMRLKHFFEEKNAEAK